MPFYNKNCHFYAIKIYRNSKYVKAYVKTFLKINLWYKQRKFKKYFLDDFYLKNVCQWHKNSKIQMM